MKKLYYLDESEKERILNLHKRYRNNLLMESKLTDEWNEITNSDATEMDSSNRRTILIKVQEFCKNNFPNEKNENLAKEIDDVYLANRSSIRTYTRRGISDEGADFFEKKIKNMSKVSELCSIFNVSNLKNTGTEKNTNIQSIFDIISDDTVFFTKIIMPMKELSLDEESNETEKKEEESETKDLTSCLVANKLPRWYYVGSYYKQEGNKTIYYRPNGSYFIEETIETEKARDPKDETKFYKFTCKNNAIIYTDGPLAVKTTNNTNTNTAVAGGYQAIAGGYVFTSNAFTPQVVTDLRTKIGSTEASSTLTQDDINKLYATISKK